MPTCLHAQASVIIAVAALLQSRAVRAVEVLRGRLVMVLLAVPNGVIRAMVRKRVQVNDDDELGYESDEEEEAAPGQTGGTAQDGTAPPSRAISMARAVAEGVEGDEGLLAGAGAGAPVGALLPAPAGAHNSQQRQPLQLAEPVGASAGPFEVGTGSSSCSTGSGRCSWNAGAAHSGATAAHAHGLAHVHGSAAGPRPSRLSHASWGPGHATAVTSNEITACEADPRPLRAAPSLAAGAGLGVELWSPDHEGEDLTIRLGPGPVAEGVQFRESPTDIGYGGEDAGSGEGSGHNRGPAGQGAGASRTSPVYPPPRPGKGRAHGEGPEWPRLVEGAPPYGQGAGGRDSGMGLTVASGSPDAEIHFVVSQGDGQKGDGKAPAGGLYDTMAAGVDGKGGKGYARGASPSSLLKGGGTSGGAGGSTPEGSAHPSYQSGSTGLTRRSSRERAGSRPGGGSSSRRSDAKWMIGKKELIPTQRGFWVSMRMAKWGGGRRMGMSKGRRSSSPRGADSASGWVWGRLRKVLGRNGKDGGVQ